MNMNLQLSTPTHVVLLFILITTISIIPSSPSSSSSYLAIAAAHSVVQIAKDPQSVENWFQNHLPKAKETTTKLHFYFHDIVEGKSPSAVDVARSNLTQTLPSGFGLVRVMDDALRSGPQPDSTILGRSQGIYALAGLDEIQLLITTNFVFTHGPYNGSTLSVLGHNPILHTYRELPILGGSGIFRLARGIATAKTFSTTGQDAVVEYNLIVLHYP